MPSLPGTSAEEEGTGMRCLQINLQGCRAAQDLAMQVARERRIDLLFFSEEYGGPPSHSNWYEDSSGRSGVLVCNPAMRVDKFFCGRGFTWVEVAGVRWYSCYFSPNVPFSDFEDQIGSLEGSVREAGSKSVITGDFNAKSPEWGETRLDKRGEVVCKMVYENALVVINRGHEWTFRRGQIGSILDLTIATPHIARRVTSWKVLEDETLSDHQYIQFSLTAPHKEESRRHKRPKQSLMWSVRKLDEDKLEQFLTEARLINELKWGKRPSTLEQQARAARHVIVAACDASMPRRKGAAQKKSSVYWWSDELTGLRAACLAARRQYTRSMGDPQLRERWYDAKCAFKKAIKANKRCC